MVLQHLKVSTQIFVSSYFILCPCFQLKFTQNEIKVFRAKIIIKA